MTPYYIDDNGSYAGLCTTDCPRISAEITHASPLFIDMLRRVQATGVPEHFEANWTFGNIEIKDAPSVMYRSDNPVEPRQ